VALQVPLRDSSTETLNPPAQTALSEAVSRYATDLLAEAGRLEAVVNTSGKPPELTSSMIQDADLLLRRGYSKPKKTRGLQAAQILAAVGGFLTGFLTDAEKLNQPLTLVAFVVILAGTITATVVSVVRE
jgi:hypothetical protein